MPRRPRPKVPGRAGRAASDRRPLEPKGWEEGWAPLPVRARIEAVAACQLKCPSCPTASGAIRPAIAPGVLSASSFERFLDRAPTLKSVELSNYGEVFLNPELRQILERAAARGVAVSIDNGANLNRLDDGLADVLVRTGVRTITCSIDGATPKTYARYRVGGDLNRVLANIDAINDAKRRHRSHRPLLVWQFVVFGHNEGEIGMARAMAAARGMSFRTKISWDDEVSPIRDHAMVARETGLPSTRVAFRKKAGRNYMRRLCHQLWVEPQFNWNGANLGCCRNFWGDFGGNVLADGFEAAFNGDRMQRARRMLLGFAEPVPDVPCTTCDLFLEMREHHNYLDRTEIEALTPRRP